MNTFRLRFLLPILFLLASTISAYAQDIVTLKNGEEIPCKVVEIAPDLVKYKRLSHLDGPTIAINKSEVFMIKYENGTKDVFNTPADPPSQPQTPPSNNPGTVTYSRIDYKREPKDHGLYNLFKFNPLAFFNGDFPFYWERRLGDHIATEVGLGFTHQDLLYTNSLFSTAPDYIERKARFGFSGRVGLHIYPSKWRMALEDWYFGPEFHFRQHNMHMTACGEVTPTDKMKEYRRLIDFRMVGGYIQHLNEQVSLDWYVGVGIRNRDLFQCNCDFTGPVTIIQEGKHNWSSVPTLALGVKLGFGL